MAALGLCRLARLGWPARRTARRGPARRQPLAGLRAVVLWFADAGGDSLVSELREMPEVEGLHERVSQLVDALGQGPEHRGLAVLPRAPRCCTSTSTTAG